VGFWINLIASVVAGWLGGAALAPKPKAAQRGTEVNKQSNIEPIPIVYGERKVSGTRVFVENSGGDNTYLYIALVLCEGEIESIGDVYIDDVLSTDSQFSGLVTIEKHLGGDNQAASTILQEVDNWTANHRLRGLAYLAIRLKWDNDAFSSMPNIHAVVKGRKVYDPRTSTTAYSENPALQLRDYLTNTRFGKGLGASFIDDTLFNAAANVCDVSVTPYAGALTQKRFISSVILETDQTLLENVKVLLSGMRGLMPYQNGKYGLIVEDEGSSTFSFNESNIIGGLSIQSETKKNKLNKCIVEFTNPDANWETDQIQYPVAGSAHEQEYLDEDGGVTLEKRVTLPTITDIYLAEDMAELIVHRSRNGLVASFNATSEALNVIVGQIVDVTHTTPAWTSKPFRVQALSLRMNGTVDVELIEHQDSIYPWSQKSEYDAYPDTNLPNPFSVVAPTPAGVTEELYTTVNSKGTQARAIFTWSAPNDAFVKEYEAEYKANGGSTWTFITKTSGLEARVDDVAAGFYDFRVRSINSMDVRSDWAELTNQNFAGLTAVPNDISGFSIRALDGQCHLSWSRITDLDVINGGYVRIRHSSLQSGATWEDGQDIGEALAGTATHVVLPMLAGTYMAKAVDEGGRFSTNAVIAVTNVPNIVDFNAVVTATEHPTFAGTRDDMIIDGSALKLDGAPRYILLESGDRLVTEAGTGISREIGDIGVIEDTGTYYFSNSVDLGGVYTSRLTAVLESSTALATDLIDNRIANIDDWANFDGEPTDKLSAELQLRLTDDDPAGSPTWSAWQPFLVGDYHARAYEFRVVVTNEDANYNINITKLEVTVDMPDRTERSNDVTISASGTAITFNSAFHATPVVGVSMQDANSGDYFRITSKTRTGFTVNCYDSTDTGIQRSINWIATGYGKEAV
jgi:hypothetical protein